jgi:hypothetical protein
LRRVVRNPEQAACGKLISLSLRIQFGCGRRPRYVVEGRVYIKTRITRKVYLVEQDKLVLQDVSILEGVEPIKFDMSDLKIEEIKKYEDMLGLKYRVFPF